MTNKLITILIPLLFITIITKGQKPIHFIGGTAHLGNGKVIRNSAISIKNDKFDLVADASRIRIDPTAFDTIYKIFLLY